MSDLYVYLICSKNKDDKDIPISTGEQGRG